MPVIDDVARILADDLPRRKALSLIGRLVFGALMAGAGARVARAFACDDPSECPPGNLCCSGNCANVATDPANCGLCGVTCDSACVGGICSCMFMETMCSGVCVNTQEDPNNCGACGNSCGGGFCVGGSCVADPCIGVLCPLGSVCQAGSCVFPGVSAYVHQVFDPDNLNVGDSYINITNAGEVNGFDPQGGICANFYAFDPSEELISCCSCYVTPDGLRSLSAQQDFLHNPLTPAKPNGLVIKVVATHPLANSTCDPTSPNGPLLAPGLRAWGTSLHRNTSTGKYEMTEREASPVDLSGSELEKLVTYCAFIKANGSGFGICNSCRVGGTLGGAIR